MNAPAAARITVTVTREHISDGTAGSCGRCPVARAFRDAVPGALAANVWFADEAGADARATVWVDHKVTLSFALPPEAARFITAFDGGEPVGPFTFEADEVLPL